MSELIDPVAMRSLVAIADTGSYTAAAAYLGLSQPAISQHIRALEARFGTPLVVREGRQSRFTVAGDRVLAEARRLLSAHDDAVQRLERVAAPTLVIGSSEHVVAGVLTHLLAAIESSGLADNVIVRIESATTLMSALSQGAVDLALLLGHDWDAPGDVVGDLPLQWLTARPVSSADADAPIPLVVNRAPCRIRNHALTLLAGAGRRTVIAAESSSLEGVLAAGRAGLGTALLPVVGAPPVGLHQRDDLPAAGTIALRVVFRRGLPDEIAEVATAAARGALSPPVRSALIA